MIARNHLAAFIAIAALAAILCAGCTGPAGRPLPTPGPTTPAPSPSLPPAGPNTFTEVNNGGTYPVSLHTVIQLRLKENPTTGFTWNLSLTPGLTVVNDTYIPDDVTGRLVGSGGTRVWYLEAMQPGDQAISAVYRRPWEPAGPGVTFFNLSLTVVEGACGANACTVPNPPSTVPPRYHVYTEADNGKAVQEPLGETFAVRLQENPTTGYSWNLSLPAGLTLSRDEFIPSQTAVQLVGAGGTRSFTLVAENRGDGNITTEYRRPWVPAGTVTRVDLEGGFFGILGDDGKKYEPLNLDARYQKDGLRIAYTATVAKNAVTARMWGTPVTLDSVEEIPGFSLRVSVK
jgi:inhibitor of cysteine peptidase